VIIIDEIIERNLDIIISSSNPLASSTVMPYIQAHRVEFDEIVSLGDDALAYMIALFEQGGQTGLRGWIMAYACHYILDGQTSLTAGTGQDWYDENKSLIMAMRPHVFLNGNAQIDVPENAVINSTFMSEIPMFIKFNYSVDWFRNKTELTPDEVSELYIIYKTFLFEKMLGNTFELDESGYYWLIPAEQAKEAAVCLTDISPDSTDLLFYNYYASSRPEYLLLSDAFSPSESEFDILPNTVAYENNIIKFDVQFYDTGNAPGEKGEKLYKFRYEFFLNTYKDLIPCYKFIQATKIN